MGIAVQEKIAILILQKAKCVDTLYFRGVSMQVIHLYIIIYMSFTLSSSMNVFIEIKISESPHKLGIQGKILEDRIQRVTVQITLKFEKAILVNIQGRRGNNVDHHWI